MTRPRLCFLHIAKTAGTTLWLVLRREYSPEKVVRIDSVEQLHALTEAQRQNLQVVLGHFPFGLHYELPEPRASVTILREPTERFLSSYGQSCRTPLQDLPAGCKYPDGTILSLVDYFRHGVIEADNLQTRSLAGPDALQLPFGQCSRDVFEVAKRNLFEGMDTVGVTERFDEFLVLLQRQYHWSMPCYVPENVGGLRPQRQQATAEELELIETYSGWDRELYRAAEARFDQLISEQGPSFVADVARLKQANIRYRKAKEKVNRGLVARFKRSLPLRVQRDLEHLYRKVAGIRS